MDWGAVVEATSSVVVVGNPPFLGHISRSAEQTQELKDVWARTDIGRLDYVTGWYKKALDYFGTTKGRFAFVSTNSVTQGEPVPALFRPIFDAGWRIKFAHQTFSWSSEAPGLAHVHCVIVGFDRNNGPASLFTYAPGSADAVQSDVSSINAYLAPAPLVFVEQRRTSLGEPLPVVSMGSMPRDGGNLLINNQNELDEVLLDTVAAKYVRKFIMGNEMINSVARWCLWLEDLDPSDIAKSPVLRGRLNAVAQSRLESSAESTRQMASTPHLFGQRSQPRGNYLGIPKVFSENRPFATCAYLTPDVIAGDKVYTCSDPDGFAFAVISSSMFITWQKSVGGRLKSDPSFSNTLVWNTLPLPPVAEESRQQIIDAGVQVLSVRDVHPERSLAEHYNPLAMDPALLQAHAALDRVVDKAFGATKALRSNIERGELLFEKYLELTSSSAG
jgi:hypothetical protein